MTASLDVKDLRKSRTQAGSRFDLVVERFFSRPGEITAVVGESGSGKSTLLDILSLIMRPDSVATFHLERRGGDFIDVADLWARRDERALLRCRREDIGYILQQGGLLPYLSVRDNILLPCAILGRRLCNEDVAEWASRLGITECLHRKPRHISGGQRQRAALLRALLHSPTIVLADEPTAALDRERGREVIGGLQEACRSLNLSAVLVTHDIELVERYSASRWRFVPERVGSDFIRSHLVAD
ncbi:ABC transporter ATP-binding protein [Mesorhizobium helmanticense]|uniref:ABC transporter ATP-binding protein n=1 Tax=Mesorhizobium helmanticense TaxID=1776423 RepID=UPI00142D5311|nr:ATP-binding cassette domain-containing protein [Mesorhizobium helmanticense]